MRYNSIFQQRHMLHCNQFLVILPILILLATLTRSIQGHAIDQTSELNAQETSISADAAQNLRWLLAKSSSGAPKSHLNEPNHDSKLTTHQPTKTSHHFVPQTTTTTTPTTTTTTTSRTNQNTKSSWIESILIDVESIALDEQERREKMLSEHQQRQTEQKEAETNKTVTDEEPADCGTTSEYLALAEMPTDSGEDPLESQVTTTSTSTIVIDQGNHTTLYDTTTSSSNNHSSSSSKPDETTLLPIDVESNNVSVAVIASVPGAVHAGEDDDDQDESKQGGSNNNYSGVVVTPTSRERLSCERAYTQCALRRACAPALRAYNDDCHDLIMNKTSKCTSKCLKSMIALRSSEEGDDLANCDCENNDYCLASKQRSQLCQADVERALEPATVVSCSTATWICAADQLCSTALDYYNRNCQTLFSLRHCSMRCNNSLAILYRQPKASKLINCQCDGSEEFPCHRYRTLTEKLCLNKHQTTTPTLGGGDGSGHASDNDNEFDSSAAQTNAAQEADEQEEADLVGVGQAATNEDDSMNLTNDPLDMPTMLDDGESGASFVTTGNDDTSEDTQAVSSNSNINFFNGIQQHQQQQRWGLAEDNWIPLVSGRYFTNLQYQQQQKRGQDHQSTGERGRQRPHKQQSSSGNQQQQQRRTSKSGTRQHRNNKSGEVRGRKHARISMFALTSSAAKVLNPLITSYCLFFNSIIAGLAFMAPVFIVRP